ncbi:MAG: hypothetical protein RSE17_00655, partial [Bacilli bacterium]
FAASPNNWNLKLFDGSINDYRSCTANNWLFAGNIHSYEWTMSRSLETGCNVFIVNNRGAVHNDGYTANSGQAVRPSFYLEPLIYLNGGKGTEVDPYRIS